LSYCLARGTAVAADAGADPFTSWGRWSDGTLQARGLLGNLTLPADRTLSPNEGIHYLVGVPSVTIPTSGEFGYSLIGATQPTISNGSVAPGTFTGEARVAFTPATAHIGIQGSISIGNGSYGFATAGGISDPRSSTLTTNASHAFSGTLGATPGGSGPLSCTGAGCSVNLQGGLFGPEAARLGLSYQIQGSGSGGPTISGVGVFQKQ